MNIFFRTKQKQTKSPKLGHPTESEENQRLSWNISSLNKTVGQPCSGTKLNSKVDIKRV
jgi:hypothetical protein